MSDIAIQVKNFSKRYRIGLKEIKSETMAGALTGWIKSPLQNLHNLRKLSHFSENNHDTDDVIWALKDVSFEIKRGEVVGIIGRNGAGKSTLLKMLSRITQPTSGRAIINGRVASLLEVGTGFHQDLTGRENVYLNGTVLGMSKREIDSKFDEIVDFSGVEKFIDTPVKRYSSGMKVRLAFSVAAHLEPEILLVDEVLAVGDADFQKKCLGKMENIATDGRTILFVSHNMAAITSLCVTGLLLGQGQVILQGTIYDVVQQYIQSIETVKSTSLEHRRDRSGNGSIKITDIQIENFSPHDVIRSSSRLKVTINYQSENPIRHAKFLVGIYDTSNTGVYLLDSDAVGGLPDCIPAKGTVVCLTDPINLTSGRCYANVAAFKAGATADYIQSAVYFDVEAEDIYGSGKIPPRNWVLCTLRHKWMLEEHNLSCL